MKLKKLEAASIRRRRRAISRKEIAREVMLDDDGDYLGCEPCEVQKFGSPSTLIVPRDESPR